VPEQLSRLLNFSVEGYDGLAKVFDIHVKGLALSTIERGTFDTRIYIEETFECRTAEILNTMADLGKTYSVGGASIIVINDEFILKSEVIRDEGALVRFKIWILTTLDRTVRLRELVLQKFSKYIHQRMALDISWAITSRNGMDYVDLQTELDETVYPEAYPYINNFNAYIDAYLDHKSPVMILIGPPGTGKTRLIKHILKTIGIRKNSLKNTDTEVEDSYDYSLDKAKCTKNPSILYSMEDKIFQDDQFFVRFLGERYDAMILEDIDFNLKSRKDGNTFMYKLLGGSDGMISGIKRKIILSTNLNGISNIDDALLRPGRCYATVHTRALNLEEAKTLANKIEKDFSKIKAEKTTGFTLAEIYNIKD